MSESAIKRMIVEMPESLHAELAEVARRHDRTVTAEVRQIVRQHVKRNQRKIEPATEQEAA